MRENYNITELNTSIKPFAFLYLFDKYPGETVVYLDPDILVLSPMTELLNCLEHGADCVLTPHITEPAEFAEMEDRQFLRYGVYNLGFCALRDTPQVKRVVSWWGRRLERYCVIDLANGIFVDQKWADLFPSFIANTKILLHPGYNVAYWNLSQRRLRLKEGEWTSNNLPLRFFHFSGNKIEDPTVFSRHSKQFRVENSGDLNRLLREYRENALEHGHEYFSALPYGFSWNGTKGENEHAPLSLAIERKVAAPGTPFLPLLRAESSEMFAILRGKMGGTLARRSDAEQSAIPFGTADFSLDGFCVSCGNPSTFLVKRKSSSHRLADGRPVPNWHEEMTCTTCGLNNRARGALHVFQQLLNPSDEAKIYFILSKETNYDSVKKLFDDVHCVSSIEELLNDLNRARKDVGDSVQCHLTPMEQLLDFVVLISESNAILREPESSLAGLLRCLKPGGHILISLPFMKAAEKDAELLPLEMGTQSVPCAPGAHEHGCRAEGNGTLRGYSAPVWQWLEDLGASQLSDKHVISYWSESLAYLGDPQCVVIAKKAL